MQRSSILLVIFAAMGFCLPFALAAGSADEASPSRAEPIELSGVLHRPIKWSPQLQVWPVGQFKQIDLQGEMLDGLEEGTPIGVKGIVRSHLHTGGDDSPFPAQWIVWMEVTEVKVLQDKRDVLSEHRP